MAWIRTQDKNLLFDAHAFWIDNVYNSDKKAIEAEAAYDGDFRIGTFADETASLFGFRRRLVAACTK